MNRTTLLAAGMLLLGSTFLAASAAILFSPGDDSEDGAALQPTAATAEPSSEPTAPEDTSLRYVLAAPGPKLVYISGLDSEYAVAGELRIATLDGTLAAPVSPIGGDAVFAGYAGGVLYYVTFLEGTARTLWALDPEAEQLQPLFSFRSRNEFDARAYVSLSPDGMFVAYTDVDSVYLFDIAGGDSRLLLRGNGPACDGQHDRAPYPLAGCFVYYGSKWSPDGALLLVDKGFYEGSRPILVDPFVSTPAEIEIGTIESVRGRAWSPDAAGFCGTHSYGGTGLYVAAAPDWEMPNLLPDYALPDPAQAPPVPRIERYIQSCDWLDAGTIAFATATVEFPEDNRGLTVQSLELSVHRLSPPDTNIVATIESDEQVSAPVIFALPGGQSVIAGYFHGPFGDYDEARPAQPVIVDVETGERTPVLAEGDWVVAVLPALAPVPAT